MEPTQARQNRVVVVSQPGVLQQALLTFLASFSAISVVACAAGALAALNVIRQQPPHLLIIDSNLPEEEAAALLRQVKQDYPQVNCLILGPTMQSRQQWLSAGADDMLTRYSSAGEMEAALRRLSRNGAV